MLEGLIGVMTRVEGLREGLEAGNSLADWQNPEASQNITWHLDFDSSISQLLNQFQNTRYIETDSTS